MIKFETRARRVYKTAGRWGKESLKGRGISKIKKEPLSLPPLLEETNEDRMSENGEISASLFLSRPASKDFPFLQGQRARRWRATVETREGGTIEEKGVRSRWEVFEPRKPLSVSLLLLHPSCLGFQRDEREMRRWVVGEKRKRNRKGNNVVG